MSPDAALAGCRFLHDASAMLVWGASAYLAALVPENLARDIGRRLRPLLLAASAVAVATIVVALPLEGAFVADGWNGALDPATLGAVLFETSIGQAWEMQAVAALILIVALLSPLRRHRVAIAMASGLLLASLALTGHAVMREGWPGAGQRFNDALHVLSAGAWTGALVPLSAILGALGDPSRRAEANVALSRFSTAGHLAVALTVVSGVINTLLIVGHWPTDWSSPYQALLACKIALVAALIGLALVNRYVFVPRLANDPLRAIGAIRSGTIAEIVVGLCVVGLVSVFGMLEPV